MKTRNQNVFYVSKKLSVSEIKIYTLIIHQLVWSFELICNKKPTIVVKTSSSLLQLSQPLTYLRISKAVFKYPCGIHILLYIASDRFRSSASSIFALVQQAAGLLEVAAGTFGLAAGILGVAAGTVRLEPDVTTCCSSTPGKATLPGLLTLQVKASRRRFAASIWQGISDALACCKIVVKTVVECGLLSNEWKSSVVTVQLVQLVDGPACAEELVWFMPDGLLTSFFSGFAFSSCMYSFSCLWCARRLYGHLFIPFSRQSLFNAVEPIRSFSQASRKG